MAEHQNKTQQRHLSILLRAGVALIACGVIAKNLDFHKLWAIFSTISPLTAAGVIVVFMISQIILAFRWWILMRAMDVHIRLWMGVKLTFLGLYFNHFLPGSVGGDLVRAWYVAQNTHKRIASVVSVLADRALALLTTLIMAGVGFWLAGSADMIKRQDTSVFIKTISDFKIPVILGSLFFAGIVILFFVFFQKKYKSIFNSILHRIYRVFQQMFDTGVVFVKQPLLLPGVMVLTFILQSMVIFSLWFLGHQMNIPFDWMFCFVVFPLTWVAGVIPVSVAGIGIVEGGIIYLLVQYGGASYESAAALAFSQRAVWIIASLPGLAVYLSGKHLPKDSSGRFSIDATP